jgi:replicative DNA helicase
VRRLHHDDAEQALIGAVILVGERAFDAAAVEPGDLYNLRHRTIWEAMVELRDNGHPPGDVQLLEDVLAEKLDLVGGLSYLAKVTEATVPDHVAEYSRLIRTSALTRRVQESLAELSQSAFEGTELLAAVMERVQGLARHVEDPTRSMPEVITAAMAELQEAHERSLEGHAVWGIPTGFVDLDDSLGGLQRGTVVILAGRPSMGKSALARSIADNVVKSDTGGAHVFSPEDNATTYAIRQIADEGNVPLDHFRSLKLKQGDLASISYVATRLKERHRWLIDDSAALSTSDIALRVRKHLVDTETALVVVDYAQLLRERDVPAHELRLQVEAVASRLVAVARNHNVCVLLLSQLSRACEGRSGNDRKPKLSDLRESGALEQIADVVMFVYRDEVYDPDTDDKGITEVLIRKNKNGPTGSVRLAWDAATATHRPLSNRAAEPSQRSF